MHDAVELERRGCPTALVVTDAFVRDVTLHRQSLGAETVEPVVIAHPLSTLSTEAIHARAADAVERVARVLEG